MEKYALFSGTRTDGYPSVHLIEPGSRYGMDKTAGLERTKTGEHLSGVQELVESIQPQPDRLYLLNSALGAGEYVGFNLRGDWFTEEGLLHTPREWDQIPVWDIDARRQRAHETEKVGSWGDLAWGYPTFYNAHRFRHHVNKDPNRAYGYILGAFWDPRMHRVILVSELIRSMCEQLGSVDIYDRIANGEFPDTSMGAKVPYDVCSICGNLARSPAAYCEHVGANALPPYGMRSILPDGRMCGVYNTHPRFFDDSFVFIGAERSAKTMSNLTDMVRGQKPYSQKVYVFGLPATKMAAAPDMTSSVSPSEDLQQSKTLSEAAKNIFQVPEPDDSLESKLSRVLDGMPLSDSREREILRFLKTKEKAVKQRDAGLLSDEEYNQLLRLEMSKIRGMGITSQEIKSYESAMTRPALPKTASTKWAEILKSIPMPASDHLATIRVHERGMPDLRKDQLSAFSEDPANSVRGAAQLGVVLRPHEFQYVMLKGQHPKEAEMFADRRMVFRPCPIHDNMDTSFDARAPLPPEILSVIQSILGSMVDDRSFAPKVVKVRITTIRPVSTMGPFLEETSNPLLDKVADLYNIYRAGLLVNTPDWRNISASKQVFGDLFGEEKIASSAIELSKELLCLAYWPALAVG